MKRGTGFLIGGLLVAIAAVAYILVTGFDAPAAVESGLQTVRDLVNSEAAPADDAEAATGEPEAASTPAPPPTPAAPQPVAAPPAETPLPVAADPPLPTAPAGADRPPLSAPSGRPALNRASHFLPGNYPTWTEFGVRVTEPLIVRAGGVVSVDAVVSGPGGVRLPAPDGAELLLPSAPYLSLLGRVCSDDTCSEPFLIGGDRTLCPGTEQLAGELQVLTNNYVRVDGRQTTSRYSTATGGFAFYTEPASAAACDPNQPSGTPMRQDAGVLAAGEVLRRPEFALSSGLTFWKPFFLPLGAPIIVRATGTIAANGRPTSGPEGVVVPEGRRWWEPREPTSSLSERRGRLYVESLPYNALIGRFCGTDGCGEPFLVGSERVLCPSAPYNDRLELWINRVISTPGMLDNQTPLTYEMFDVQTQRGGYEFEVASAPRGACGGAPSR